MAPIAKMVEYIRALEDALRGLDCPPEFSPEHEEQDGCIYCGGSPAGFMGHPSESDHAKDCPWLVTHRLLAGVFCPNCGVRTGQTHTYIGGQYYYLADSNEAKAIGCREGEVYA